MDPVHFPTYCSIYYLLLLRFKNKFVLWFKILHLIKSNYHLDFLCKPALKEWPKENIISPGRCSYLPDFEIQLKMLHTHPYGKQNRICSMIQSLVLELGKLWLELLGSAMCGSDAEGGSLIAQSLWVKRMCALHRAQLNTKWSTCYLKKKRWIFIAKNVQTTEKSWKRGERTQVYYSLM